MVLLRLILTAGLLGSLFVSTSAMAADRYAGVNLIRGTVYSIGRADPRGQGGAVDDLPSGILFDANYSSVFINGGFGAKDFDGQRVVNAYAGIGLGRIVQLQAGIGDRGPLGRIRADLNLREVYSFVTQQRQVRREKTLADRVTFTYTAESYSDKDSEEFDNGTIGIGVLFEGPF
ncbi:MAG: hypothetical protein ACOY9J_02735 [Pseudomonadota bacterium]